MNPKKVFHTFRRPKAEDPGFGTYATDKGGRFINKDGTFNVKRTGISFLKTFSIYQWLISIHWTKFTLVIIINYLTINSLFASCYYFIGVEYLGGVIAQSRIEKFWEAFFFSTQTFTTIGYGRINPVSFSTNVVASIEGLSGLLFIALMSGLLYGRFSKPNAKILYSNNAIIAPYFEITGFMFRIANARNNQLLDVHVEVSLSRNEEIDGKQIRKYYELPLERSLIEFFPLSWTIVHPIDENSPINGIGLEELKKTDAEFLILIKAFDDTFSQNVHSRNSFKYHEIEFGVKYVPIFARDKDGYTRLELDKISDTFVVEVNNS